MALKHLLGELLPLGVLQLQASAFLERLFFSVLNIVLDRVLAQQSLAHLQLRLFASILRFGGWSINGSPSTSFPAICGVGALHLFVLLLHFDIVNN